MKFSLRLFIATFVTVSLSFGIGGFILVTTFFNISLDHEMQSAVKQHKYLCFLYSSTAKDFSTEVTFPSLVLVDENTDIQVFGVEDESEKKALQTTQVQSEGENKYFYITSNFVVNGKWISLATKTDISPVYENRSRYLLLYQLVLIGIVGISSVVYFLISRRLTRPIVQLSEVTSDIAAGDFSKRLATDKDTEKTTETAILTKNFNLMAQVVDETMAMLKENAKKKEDFIANFTHELKTPMTAIIGYADMLRSYDLEANNRRKAAEFIFEESKRLEMLSLKLLELFINENHEVDFQRVPSATFFEDIKQAVQPLLDKYDMFLDCDVEQSVIIIEPVLLKTLMYNLIDNACKASSPGQSIALTGMKSQSKYRITVQDCGKGMKKEDLPHILEPFYTVDRSRTRSQGGAGLGLSLCAQIAELHHTKLDFESEPNKGTSVSLFVEVDEDA